MHYLFSLVALLVSISASPVANDGKSYKEKDSYDAHVYYKSSTPVYYAPNTPVYYASKTKTPKYYTAPSYYAPPTYTTAPYKPVKSYENPVYNKPVEYIYTPPLYGKPKKTYESNKHVEYKAPAYTPAPYGNPKNTYEASAHSTLIYKAPIYTSTAVYDA